MDVYIKTETLPVQWQRGGCSTLAWLGTTGGRRKYEVGDFKCLPIGLENGFLRLGAARASKVWGLIGQWASPVAFSRERTVVTETHALAMLTKVTAVAAGVGRPMGRRYW
jgi:hypothetical protein